MVCVVKRVSPEACLIFLMFWKSVDLADLSTSEIFITLSSIRALGRKKVTIEIMIIKATYWTPRIRTGCTKCIIDSS